MSDLDRNAVTLNCYDPAGARIEISERELLNHMLIVGATGSGKTSRIVLPVFDELCRGRNGLLLIDGKGDPSFKEALLESSSRNGRSIVEIDGSGGNGIDPFAPMRRRGLQGIEEVCECLCEGLPVDIRNRYWDVVFKNVFENALRILFLTSPEFEYEEAVDWLYSYILSYSRNLTSVVERIDTFKNLIFRKKLAEKGSVVNGILKSHEMWENLDLRTRSNLQSMAVSVIEPLASEIALGYFSTEVDIDLGKVLDSGAIVLVSVDAFGNRSFARLLATLVKSRCFRALMLRKEPDLSWGLIFDDWTLCVSGGLDTCSSESAALPFIRSKRGFLIAACQSLSGIDRILGVQEREAAIANFGTLAFMRNRDFETDLLAARTFADGEVDSSETMRVRDGDGQADKTLSVVRRQSGSRAPVGTLSSLATGEVMISVCERAFEGRLFLEASWEREEEKERGHWYE